MASNTPLESSLGLPERPVQRLTKPLVRFLHVQSAGGIVLILATVIALTAANSSYGPDYRELWEHRFRIGVGSYGLDYPLWYWINDALMTIFFFVIGLEIKRELAIGELSEPRKVVLPVIAAIGGAVVPVAIFMALQYGGPGQRGWAVPMATDIAFVVGALALLGNRVPHGLKVLMLSLAIIDDLMAVIVIAVFYASTVKFAWMMGTVAALATATLLNRFGVRRVGVYFPVGAVAWLCALKSGVHPTLAGVLLGLLTPTAALFDRETIVDLLDRGRRAITKKPGPETDAASRAVLGEIAFATTEAVPPLVRLETSLHPWVAFVIMPVFALANAGVEIRLDVLADPLAVAVALGLVVGKPVGITLAAWLGVRAGIASLPTGVSWAVLIGGACLAGIGFTMAIFIAGLGLEDAALVAAKNGILAGSLVSGIAGMAILWVSARRPAAEPATAVVQE